MRKATMVDSDHERQRTLQTASMRYSELEIFEKRETAIMELNGEHDRRRARETSIVRDSEHERQ